MRVVVDAGEPVRLDRFIAEQLGGRSRRATRELVAAGAVRVNGRRAGKGHLLRPGDVVEIEPAPITAAGALRPQPEMPLNVRYADDALVALDKPAGVPAVALRATDRDTLANALLARFPELAGASVDPLEAGLVHRLDTATSGVILAARTRAAWSAVRAQFTAGTVDKRYVALVAGLVAEPGTIRTPIAHHPRRRREMRVCEPGEQARALRARPALTRFTPLGRYKATTLLGVTIATGVRHQIRVHLASIGHPIAGDPLYGRDQHVVAAVPRLMLHALRLRLRHPISGREVEINSPEPQDFQAVLRELREARPRHRP